MTRQEREHFLAQPLICTLATSDPDGWPYVTPLWYEWSESSFWIIGARHARWLSHLQRDTRVALCVEDLNPTRRVICQGRARLVDGPIRFGAWSDMLTRLATRYVPFDAPAYVDGVVEEVGWLIAVTPLRLVTWTGPSRSLNRDAAGVASRNV
jgi:nitroimidazol reductase NimA-like FMN-containing flavoprotein (pyridoxamine 5'-phosphate oxidase superfamily)